jgi:ribosomal protein S18 acetylase RimI-like enzyme
MTGVTSSVTAEIRRLVAADWAALRGLRLAALTEAPYAFSSTLERELGFDELRWRERLDSTAHFGAWRSGQLVGLAAGFPELGEPHSQNQHSVGQSSQDQRSWHLVSMWVAPGERGQGTADRLVSAVCELARDRGAGQIALWVTDVNARALAFYRRAGFRLTGERQLVRPEEPGSWEERMTRELP